MTNPNPRRWTLRCRNLLLSILFPIHLLLRDRVLGQFRNVASLPLNQLPRKTTPAMGLALK
jgi:hypothetical protein